MTISTKPMVYVSLFGLLISVSMCLSLCGCCGGGSNSVTTSTTGPQTKTVNGLLLGSDGSVQVGDKVVYDVGTTQAVSAQTDSAGKYVLTLPVSAVTGSDTLTFYDSAGHALETVSVTLTADTATQSITTTLAPPNRPTGI